MPDVTLNPAEQAAKEAQNRIHQCIDDGKSFRVEAGAGAGKTYSLIEALKYSIAHRGANLLRHHQQIACITYTNAAKDEIEARTDRHPAILSSTIHSFCWSVIRDFQPFLRLRIAELGKWSERLDEAGGIENRTIQYDLGYPKVEERRILLHHDDVLALTVQLIEQAKFRKMLKSRFPILFIDEYQDTDRTFAEAIKTHCLETGDGPLIGLFGDHWQKIYGNGAGQIEHPRLEVIQRGANFRSVPAVVDVLNRMRPELPQEVTDPGAQGIVAVYHTNDSTSVRLTGQHWAGDLPPAEANLYLDAVIDRLTEEGWEHTKILMLTHNALARKQGYTDLARVFPYNDYFLKKQDPHIEFLVDTVEPMRIAYEQRRFGEMFAVLRSRVPSMRSHSDKQLWTESMDKLVALCANATIGQVIDHLGATERPKVSDAVKRRERVLYIAQEGENDEDRDTREQVNKLRDIPYRELEALAQFIEQNTPFSTKHGVKGAEFENVLVVFGRGWNQYNFVEFLNWAGPDGRVPANKQDKYERNRNLFYVACSRAKTRLALLFTQELNDGALSTLHEWFGRNSVHTLQIHE